MSSCSFLRKRSKPSALVKAASSFAPALYVATRIANVAIKLCPASRQGLWSPATERTAELLRKTSRHTAASL